MFGGIVLLQIPSYFIIFQIMLSIIVIIYLFKRAEEKENVSKTMRNWIVVGAVGLGLFLAYGLPALADWLHKVLP